jgi:hypothetical protein
VLGLIQEFAGFNLGCHKIPASHAAIIVSNYSNTSNNSRK